MSSIKKNIAGKHVVARKGLKIGIVRSEYNAEIVDALWSSCMKTLLASGVEEKNVAAIRVPGAYEIPFACQQLAKSRKVDALIALGAVIRGGTPHFEYVAGSCAEGIMDVSLRLNIPIAFGVLTTDNLAQAKARTDKGAEAALTALAMVHLNV